MEKGYKVCFERITNLIRLLKTAEVQKKSEYRIRRIMKSDLIIIDEIGYTPIEKREANFFFNLISETYEKASIIVTSNKSFDSWAEMMGDSVMTTALLGSGKEWAFSEATTKILFRALLFQEQLNQGRGAGTTGSGLIIMKIYILNYYSLF